MGLTETVMLVSALRPDKNIHFHPDQVKPWRSAEIVMLVSALRVNEKHEFQMFIRIG